MKNYKTYSYNCDTNVMLSKLDRATIDGRAVITEVKCAKPAARHARAFNVPQVVTSEVFVSQESRTEYVEHIEYKPASRLKYVRKPAVKPCVKNIVVASVVEHHVSECGECCGCVAPEVEVRPVFMPVIKPVAPVESVVIDEEDDEIIQCEKYGKCAS